MFDVGFWELAVIGVVALIIVGPQRLPGVAYRVGLWLSKARKTLNEVKTDFNRELREQNIADLGALKRDIEDAGGQFKDATQALKQPLQASSQQASPPTPTPTAQVKRANQPRAKVAQTSSTKRAAKKPVETAPTAVQRYYLYQNQQKKYTAIHIGSCGHCKQGQGRGGGSKPAHTAWHGPFITLEVARKQQGVIGGAKKECKCAAA